MRARYYQNLADSFYASGMYELSLAMLKEALRVDSSDASNHGRRGLVLHKLGRYEEAVAAFKKALEINPRSCGIRNNLGRSYYRLGLFREAIREHAAALRCDPENERLALNLRLARYGSGNPFWKIYYFFSPKKDYLSRVSRGDEIVLRRRQGDGIRRDPLEDRKNTLIELLGVKEAWRPLYEASMVKERKRDLFLELCNEALRLEYDSVFLYNFFALHEEDERLSLRLKEIAGLEVEHGRILFALIESLGGDPAWSQEPQTIAVKDLRELLEESITIEDRSVAIFEKAKVLAPDEARREQLEKFQRDELQHKGIFVSILSDVKNRMADVSR